MQLEWLSQNEIQQARLPLTTCQPSAPCPEGTTWDTKSCTCHKEGGIVATLENHPVLVVAGAAAVVGVFYLILR